MYINVKTIFSRFTADWLENNFASQVEINNYYSKQKKKSVNAGANLDKKVEMFINFIVNHTWKVD